jgi:oligopeptide transport system substrate-binding protein
VNLFDVDNHYQLRLVYPLTAGSFHSSKRKVSAFMTIFGYVYVLGGICADIYLSSKTIFMSIHSVFTLLHSTRFGAVRLLMSFIILLVASATTSATGVNYSARSIAIAISQEPPDLNTSTSTDSVSFMVLNHIMEGLLSYDQDQNLVAGVAESWELRSDGATFTLRKDARWSDGSSVTAHDFVFAWRKVLEPSTGSQYAFILYPILNAQAINEGKLPPSELGMTAVDDHTLEIKLFQPCPYFLGLTAFSVLNPIKESFYLERGQRYAADVSDLLFNGPFKLTQWVHGASMKMEKNNHYWNKSNVWLNTINVPYITEDPNARMNLYRDGEVAMASGLNEESLLGALHERMQIKTFLDGSIFFVEFNYRDKRISANKNFRKAIQAVFNTDDLVYKIQGSPGSYPVYTLYPRWMKGVKDDFVREYPQAKPELNIERGREYLALAKQELGIESFPVITLLAGDSPGSQKISEYFQTLMQQTLGLEIKVDAQIFKQRLAKMTAGEFDLVMAGWGPDYNDLLTYGDLFASYNLNNRGRYNNPEYDRWVAVAQSSLEPKVRMAAFNELQKIIADDVVIIPLYERGAVYVQHSRVKNIARRAIGGDPNFNFAYIEPELELEPEQEKQSP